jgi:hypothetical protein
MVRLALKRGTETQRGSFCHFIRATLEFESSGFLPLPLALAKQPWCRAAKVLLTVHFSLR